MTIVSEPSSLPRRGQLAVEAIRDAFAADLRGLYLYGSAVAGGLQQSSDLDLLAILAAPAHADRYRLLAHRLLALSRWDPETRTGRPVELTVLALPDLVPWRHPPRKEFQFGEWLRPELERDEIAAPSEDPDVTILVAAARRRSVAFDGPPLAQLIDPVPDVDLRRAMADVLPQLIQDFSGDERNVILTLARIWVGLSSGDIVSKDEAAARMLKQIDPDHRPTLDLARRAYLGEARDDWGAQERAARAFVEYTRHQIGRLARRSSAPGSDTHD